VQKSAQPDGRRKARNETQLKRCWWNVTVETAGGYDIVRFVRAGRETFLRTKPNKNH